MPKTMWQKIGSIDERAVAQIQLVRTESLRPLWSSPSMNVNNRNEGDLVVLDCYAPALAFVSVPMLSQGHLKLQEEKLASGIKGSVKITQAKSKPKVESPSAPKKSKEEEGGQKGGALVDEKDSAAVTSSSPKRPLITEVDELD